MASKTVGKGDKHKRNSATADNGDRHVSKKARPSDDYSNLSKAKEGEVIGRLQAAGLPDGAEQHFKQAWSISGSKQNNNKYSWSFRGPNSVREQSISGVVRWYKTEWQGQQRQRGAAKQQASGRAGTPGHQRADAAAPAGVEEDRRKDDGDGVASYSTAVKWLSILTHQMCVSPKLGYSRDGAITASLAIQIAGDPDMRASASQPAQTVTASTRGGGAAKKPVQAQSAKPSVQAEAPAKPTDADNHQDEAESFDAYKHLTKNMVVLMRSEEEEDVSGWKFPWSIARVNRLDKASGLMSVTWLKPEKMEDWWKQKWQPWMLKGKGKRTYPWVDEGIEMDTVQWGTTLGSNGIFQGADQKLLREEVQRLEEDNRAKAAQTK